jgi:hypothetical protein
MMSEKWDPANAARYTCAAEMPAAVRRSWYEANKPDLGAKPEQPKPQQTTTVAMDAEAQAAWNAWARTIAKQQILAYETQALGPVLGDIGEVTGTLRREINELRGDLGQLRAQVEILRTSTTDAAAVIDLPRDFLRRKDAA